GRLRAADHVRRPGRPHRRALERLHAPVWRGLGVPGLDVLDRGPGGPRPGPRRQGVPPQWLRPQGPAPAGIQHGRSQMTKAETSGHGARRLLTIWTPEDKAFWETEGRAIANQN